MDVAGRLRQRVKERNRELGLEAVVALVMGVVFTIITFGVIFWLTWLFGFCAFRIGSPAQMAGIVTGVLFVVAVWSAWRKVDPNVNLTSPTAAQRSRGDAVDMMGYSMGVPIFTRRSIAGAGMMLIGGPANLFDAWGIWRHRLPGGAALIRSASALLQDAEQGVPMNDLGDPQPALLLHRLALIRSEIVGDGDARVRLTLEGEELLRGVG